jgi:hypothetical protein
MSSSDGSRQGAHTGTSGRRPGWLDRSSQAPDKSPSSVSSATRTSSCRLWKDRKLLQLSLFPLLMKSEADMILYGPDGKVLNPPPPMGFVPPQTSPTKRKGK